MSKAQALWIVSFAFIMICPASLRAEGLPPQEHACLMQMPDFARVVAEMHGSDDVDTAARQQAALGKFTNIVSTLKWGTTLSPEEQKILDALWAADRALGPNTRKFDDAQQKRYSEVEHRLGNDATFEAELFQKYLPPDWPKQYREIEIKRGVVQQPEPPQSAASRFFGGRIGLFIIGGALLVAFTWVLTWVRKRRFERTNSSGVEGFKSYASMVNSRALEWFANAFAAVLFMVAFIVLIAACVAKR